MEAVGASSEVGADGEVRGAGTEVGRTTVGATIGSSSSTNLPDYRVDHRQVHYLMGAEGPEVVEHVGCDEHGRPCAVLTTV